MCIIFRDIGSNAVKCTTINVLFLAAPSATVCHTRLENPILETRKDEWYLFVFIFTNVANIILLFNSLHASRQLFAVTLFF